MYHNYNIKQMFNQLYENVTQINNQLNRASYFQV